MKQNLLMRVLCLCGSLWVGISCALAADGSADAPFRFYSVADGLTQSEVYDIAQDQAGYLWITTARGLNRYDGQGFDHYTIADGLPSNALTAIYAGADNSILVGDVHGGITVMQGSRVLHTIRPLGDSNAAITDLEVVGQAILAVVEDVGIVEITPLADEYQSQLIGDEEMGISDLVVFGTDVWVTSTTGLYKLTFGGGTKLTKLSDHITSAHADAAGVVWLADSENRIGIWENGQFMPRAEIESESNITGIATDVNGTIWVTTNQELFKIHAPGPEAESVVAPIRRFDGIDTVSSLFVDRENSVWLTSRSRLTRFLGDRFQHFPLRTDNNPEHVWTIAEDKLGRIWFGTQNKLVVRELDETLRVIDAEYGVPEGAVRDVVADSNGDLWFSVTDEGLFRLDVDSDSVQRIERTTGQEILDIGIGSDGVIWLATGDSGGFRYLPASDELSRIDVPNHAAVHTLDTAADGSIWYGANGVGVVHLEPDEDGKFEQTVYGLDSGLQNRLFNQINLTGPGEAWVATHDGGLYRFESGQFSAFGNGTPFADQTVYLVESLDNGSVVVGGEQGLYQLFPGTTGVAHYNQQVGFTAVETNEHATFIDSRNWLWIGTVNGATRMDVKQTMSAYAEPSPMVISTETGLDRLQVLDNGEIEPDQLGVRIEFAAISLLNPEGIEYSYRLVGAEEGWGLATTNRSVSYPRIPPANYEFMVRARYPGGDWSHEFASNRFVVLPYFWQEPWFVFAIVLVTLVVLRAAMVYRTRNVERQNETLLAQVEERTRSIEDAKQRLEQSNWRLSREVESRHKSDTARAEMETRFRKAFENAPIGMGLLDADGVIFDANPALRKMFWIDAPASLGQKFSDVVDDHDKERFERDYENIIQLRGDEHDKKFSCKNANGDFLQTLVSLSPVTSDEGVFLYAVLQVQDITESLKLTSQLEYQASYDELTGLLNRRAFETELQRAWDKGSGGKGPSYLMFMDLDQFKVVNDTSGHNAGDQLLKGVSKILNENVRANDTVARLGGDEFGLILWECPPEVANRIAESIRSGIEDYRFHWDAETYRIGVSIGGLPIEQSSGDISELQQLADAACYAAKEAGRNRVHMVAGDKDSARVRRGQVRWVQRLREAMDNNRFAIYGQVIQPLADNVDEPEQVEILLRLRDPESRKLIPPGAFLPAAERYGLSVELDQWVVGSLLDTLFVHQAFQAEDRTYWINLSGTSIGDKRFAVFLKSAIERSPLPPGTINFEITETAVIRSVTEAGRLMTELREMGCKFALDDFGSGLSSFGYLKKLPVDYLKIDGMFIRDILLHETNRIFVKSIIDIARSLNIKTIAEFVESKDMLSLVRDLGADYAQGFVIGRPFMLAPKLPGIDAGKEPIELQKRAG